MTRLTVFMGCLLFAVAGQVWAQCNAGTRISPGTAINDELSGKTVCGTGVGPNAGDQWQEWHQVGGKLTEYAKGPSDPVDPTHDVGNWATSGQGQGRNSVVTYTYDNDSGGPYSFNVHDNGGGNYSFCSSTGQPTQIATATLIMGQGPCGF